MLCYGLLLSLYIVLYSFFFFNDTATTEIYTLSLHDALPISRTRWPMRSGPCAGTTSRIHSSVRTSDRKSTRLNSSHQIISYAVFCLKKKKKEKRQNAACCKRVRWYIGMRQRARSTRNMA